MSATAANPTPVSVTVERILDAMQATRDFYELRRMNGDRCGAKQRYSLLRYMSAGVQKARRRARRKKS